MAYTAMTNITMSWPCQNLGVPSPTGVPLIMLKIKGKRMSPASTRSVLHCPLNHAHQRLPEDAWRVFVSSVLMLLLLLP